jgi:hypothetical protein
MLDALCLEMLRENLFGCYDDYAMAIQAELRISGCGTARKKRGCVGLRMWSGGGEKGEGKRRVAGGSDIALAAAQ